MEKTVMFDDMGKVIAIFGQFDRNVNEIQKKLHVKIVNRDSSIKITGDEANVNMALDTVKKLSDLIDNGEVLSDQTVSYAISMAMEGVDTTALYGADCICVSASGKPIKSKTMGQKSYVDSIKNNTITFGIGPAGTGKTYLAVAMAVTAFKNKLVNRIILTRPAIEAGEKLGFYPVTFRVR